MKGNFVARHMNTVNRNSVHVSAKRLLLENDQYWIDEGIQEKIEKEEDAKNNERDESALD